ncbi:MAG: hypothetical protein H3C34_29610, partial [Caldilineaceae bacterium]|nr:hypothetical protein [Caldilineaceae bacterium]
RPLPLLCVSLGLLLLFFLALATSRASAAEEAGNGELLCRFGAGVYRDLPATDFDLAALRVGWIVNFTASETPTVPAGMTYAPLVDLRQVGEDDYAPKGPALDAAIAANPGADWLLGTEPDRPYLLYAMEPAVYAHAYHDLYAYIRARDPEAHIFPAGIVQPTPLRLQYLDLVLEAYQARYGVPLPADGWSIHNFMLNERSCAVYPDDCWGAEIPPGVDADEGLRATPVDSIDVERFVAQLYAFRRWMVERGYTNQPLYISEYGMLMPPDLPPGFPPPVVSEFMTRTFAAMATEADPELGYAPDGGRLVQRFAWYATVEPYFNGGLWASTNYTNPLSPPYVLTPIGAAYRDYTAGLPATTDLASLELAGTDAGSPGAAGPLTVALTATVSNSGSRAATTTASVRFYVALPGGGALQLGDPQTIALSGCGATAVVTATTTLPTPAALQGLPVYVEVTSAGHPDIDPTNNRAGPWLLPGPRVYLPAIRGSP